MALSGCMTTTALNKSTEPKYKRLAPVSQGYLTDENHLIVFLGDQIDTTTYRSQSKKHIDIDLSKYGQTKKQVTLSKGKVESTWPDIDKDATIEIPVHPQKIHWPMLNGEENLAEESLVLFNVNDGKYSFVLAAQKNDNGKHKFLCFKIPLIEHGKSISRGLLTFPAALIDIVSFPFQIPIAMHRINRSL